MYFFLAFFFLGEVKTFCSLAGPLTISSPPEHLTPTGSPWIPSIDLIAPEKKTHRRDIGNPIKNPVKPQVPNVGNVT